MRPTVILLMVMLSGNAYAKSGIEEAGDITMVLVPAIALGMTLNEEKWEGTWQLVLSFGAAQATVEALKSIVDEERPNGTGSSSFPSGHSASAFSGATLIHKRYGLRQAIVPYALAAFTGYSRVHADKHYVHDVLASAAISAAYTWLFVEEEAPKVQLSVTPKSFYLGFEIKF